MVNIHVPASRVKLCLLDDVETLCFSISASTCWTFLLWMKMNRTSGFRMLCSSLGHHFFYYIHSPENRHRRTPQLCKNTHEWLCLKADVCVCAHMSGVYICSCLCRSLLFCLWPPPSLSSVCFLSAFADLRNICGNKDICSDFHCHCCHFWFSAV